MSVVPPAQALKTLWHATAIHNESAKIEGAQKAFLKACKEQECPVMSEMPEKVPLPKHVKGMIHLAVGDTSGAAFSRDAMTRTGLVLGHGVLQSIGTMPILGGVAARQASTLLNDGNERAPHRRYNPGDDLGAMHGCEPDWRGCIIDDLIVSVGNLGLHKNGPERRQYMTTKIFRVEGESAFLSKDGVLRFEANGRLFSGIGGSIIKAPVQLGNSTLYLLRRHATKQEEYHTPTLLEYRDAVDELRQAYGSYPALRRFETKSFRLATSHPDRMLRYIPANGSPSPAGVVRIDITKTSTACLQPLYAPIMEGAPPCTYKEPYCAWQASIPHRLKQHMYHQHVTYGCVRTFVIPAAAFGKPSLGSKIAETISDQELQRLGHGPVSVSYLSQTGIDSIEIRFEPVRRLRQTREVRCSRRLIGDSCHGRYTEYLAEFGDGSTSWIPSCNVADDLKGEFWDVVTAGAEEVTEIVKSDPAQGTLTVKRADGREEPTSETRIFWQPEDKPAMLSDVELESIMHHTHYGVDYTHFIPCTLLVEADWARVELLSYGAMIMQDPVAAKTGEYAGVRQDGRMLQLGTEYSFKFNSRTVSFIVASNGAPFDIKATSGWFNGDPRNEERGRFVLTVREERFENVFNLADKSSNQRTIRVRPPIITPGLLTIETNWGAIEVTSADATIGPDPTVDQSAYDEIVFDGRSMIQRSGVLGEKFVIPFLLSTRDEHVDIAITHGADKGPGHGDCRGTATATFGKGTYTGPWDPRNPLTNSKTFLSCKVGERPPMVPR